MSKENLIKRSGKWTVEKQWKLYLIAKKYLGNKAQMAKGDWNTIAEIIDAKTGTACRMMFYNNVRPDMERKAEPLKDLSSVKASADQLSFIPENQDFISILLENNKLLKSILQELFSRRN